MIDMRWTHTHIHICTYIYVHTLYCTRTLTCAHLPCVIVFLFLSIIAEDINVKQECHWQYGLTYVHVHVCICMHVCTYMYAWAYVRMHIMLWNALYLHVPAQGESNLITLSSSARKSRDLGTWSTDEHNKSVLQSCLYEVMTLGALVCKGSCSSDFCIVVKNGVLVSWYGTDGSSDNWSRSLPLSYLREKILGSIRVL